MTDMDARIAMVKKHKRRDNMNTAIITHKDRNWMSTSTRSRKFDDVREATEYAVAASKEESMVSIELLDNDMDVIESWER